MTYCRIQILLQQFITLTYIGQVCDFMTHLCLVSVHSAFHSTANPVGINHCNIPFNRDGNIIPYDTDMDIFVLGSDEEKIRRLATVRTNITVGKVRFFAIRFPVFLPATVLLIAQSKQP